MTQLGEVQKLVLRTAVRNGVQVKRAAVDRDAIGKPLSEVKTVWQKRWVGRPQLNGGVYERRENDVTKASNRVSVSRAVHALVERELLDAQYVATAVIEDGAERIAHHGEPSVTGSTADENGTAPTYSLLRLSNKGEKLVRELRSRERNVWSPEIRGGGL
jgi:hypothetical protein